MFMDLIWANREGVYFCAKDWTGSISLIGLEKFGVRRTRSHNVDPAFAGTTHFLYDASRRR